MLDISFKEAQHNRFAASGPPVHVSGQCSAYSSVASMEIIFDLKHPCYSCHALQTRLYSYLIELVFALLPFLLLLQLLFDIRLGMGILDWNNQEDDLFPNFDMGAASSKTSPRKTAAATQSTNRAPVSPFFFRRNSDDKRDRYVNKPILPYLL